MMMLAINYPGDTRLSEDELMKDSDQLDDDFLEVFRRAMEAADLLLERQFAQNAKAAYLGFAEHVGGNKISDEEALRVEMWVGYHPVMLLFRRLEAYGMDGHFHYVDASMPNQSESLKKDIESASEFHAWVSPEWLPVSEIGGKGQFGDILLASKARSALDSGSDLTVDEINALSGVSKRSVQNALSEGGETGLKLNSNGQVSHLDASQWLQGRRNFKPTRTDELEVDLKPESIADSDGRFVFVPVSNDGSAFLPDTRSSSGFRIGEKGNEQVITDFDEALERLQDMEKPCWRRKNSKGNWGLVSGQSWRRVRVQHTD